METSCHCLPASGCGVWPRLSGTPNGMCKPHPTSDFQQRIQSSLDQTVMNRCLSHSAFSVKIYRCLCMWDCVWIRETWAIFSRIFFPVDFMLAKCYMHLQNWRRKWHPTPVFLPGESHGSRSLAGYSPRGHKKSDVTELLSKCLQNGTKSSVLRWAAGHWTRWVNPGQHLLRAVPTVVNRSRGGAVGQSPGWEGPGLTHHSVCGVSVSSLEGCRWWYSISWPLLSLTGTTSVKL